MLMAAWFESLHVLEQIFFFIALPASVIMLIQTVMLFFGAGGGGTGVGMEVEISGIEDGGDGGMAGGSDESGDSVSSGLRFVTTRGVVAFFTVAGWTGILCMQMGMLPVLSALMAAGCGFGAMVGVAFLVQWLLGLSSSGNMDYRTALGSFAEVYLRIPGDGGKGKIHLIINGAHRECDAITEDGSPVGTGRTVRVTDIMQDGVLVVEPVIEKGREKEKGRGN